MAKEKWIATGMAAVIAIGLLTGCGSKDANADAATDTAKEVASSIQGAPAAQPTTPAEAVLSESPASDFEYKEEDGKITITHYTGKSMEIVIPAQIDGKDVTAIGEDCFTKQPIVRVVCPDTLESIGENAFDSCKELEEIVLKEGLQTIETHAFHMCKSLEYVKIPNTVVFVGEFAFMNSGIQEIEFLCNSVEWKMGVFNGIKAVDLTIPSNNKTIGFAMFANCRFLESVVIEEGVEKIERTAFSDCKELKKVSIPASVTEMGEDVFRGVNEEIVLTVQPESYAESYAKENGIAYMNP